MGIIIGIILIAVGFYLVFFQRTKHASDLLEIQAQETKTIPEVREALEAMADIDPNYREMVELKGFAQASQPVNTPYSNRPVAFYTAQTVQVSEETEEYRDNEGNLRTRTHKHEDKLADEESAAELLLKDNVGNEVVIETNGVSSKLDLQKSFDRFERDDPYRNGGYYDNPYRRFHRYDIRPYGAGYRVLGYKQIENTFPVNAPLYALGEAYMINGRIYLGPPRDSKKAFIVTTKSEEELVKSKKSSQMFTLIGGAACILIGIITMIAGIVG